MIVVAAVALLAAASPHPRVSSATGVVKVGHEGAWRDAAKGVEIGESEFVTVAEGASVSITLADGKPVSFEGKRVIPGRRLAKSGDVFLSGAMQKATALFAVDEGTSSTPGATKNCSDEDRKLGKCSSSAPGFDSAASDGAAAAGAAERARAAGKAAEARTLAAKALETADPPDAARAHGVLGELDAADGLYASAEKELALAADAAAPEAVRARALLTRARMEIDLGDGVHASDDLAAVRALDKGALGARAALLQEALAVERGDLAAAREIARELEKDRDLGAAAQSLVRK